MFSIAEKRHLAQIVETAIRELNHPEMDNDNIRFSLHIDGKESWSWADIHPNSERVKGEPNGWNEVARYVMKGSDSA